MACAVADKSVVLVAEKEQNCMSSDYQIAQEQQRSVALRSRKILQLASSKDLLAEGVSDGVFSAVSVF